jgi:hypothetical protein
VASIPSATFINFSLVRTAWALLSAFSFAAPRLLSRRGVGLFVENLLHQSLAHAESRLPIAVITVSDKSFP